MMKLLYEKGKNQIKDTGSSLTLTSEHTVTKQPYGKIPNTPAIIAVCFVLPVLAFIGILVIGILVSTTSPYWATAPFIYLLLVGLSKTTILNLFSRTVTKTEALDVLLTQLEQNEQHERDFQNHLEASAQVVGGTLPDQDSVTVYKVQMGLRTTVYYDVNRLTGCITSHGFYLDDGVVKNKTSIHLGNSGEPKGLELFDDDKHEWKIYRLELYVDDPDGENRTVWGVRPSEVSIPFNSEVTLKQGSIQIPIKQHSGELELVSNVY